MGRVKGSGKYIYREGDGKHSLSPRQCAYCGVEYLGRVDNNSRYCSRRCSSKATGKQPRPTPSRAGHLVCTKCGGEKLENAFSRHAQSASGRRPRCKACVKAEWKISKTPERLAAMREYGHQYTVANRARLTAKTAAWREANPDAVRAIDQRHKAKRRAAPAVEFDVLLLSVKWAYWAGRCWMCGGGATEWDHVKPLARGGIHCLANLRPACRSCNAHKSARWPYRP